MTAPDLKKKTFELKINHVYTDVEYKSNEGKYCFRGYLETGDIDLLNDVCTADCMIDIVNQINDGINGNISSFKGSDDHDVLKLNNKNLPPVSKLTYATYDGKGVLVEGEFNTDYPEFKKIWNQVSNGYYDGLSIEYRATDYVFKDIDDDGHDERILNRVKITGYGHTPRPVQQNATLTDVFMKSLTHIQKKGVDKMTEKTGKKSEPKEDSEMKSLTEENSKLKEEVKSLKTKLKELEEIKLKEEKKSEEAEDEKIEEKPKETESKSFDDLEEKIRKVVKEELKSKVPEKKELPDATPKFEEEKKSKEPQTLADHVVRSLGA